jgi:hypothetical protein
MRGIRWVPGFHLSGQNDSICLFVARMLQCVCVGPLVRYLSALCIHPCPRNSALDESGWLALVLERREAQFPRHNSRSQASCYFASQPLLEKVSHAGCALFTFPFFHTLANKDNFPASHRNKQIYMKHFFANSTSKSVWQWDYFSKCHPNASLLCITLLMAKSFR